MRQNNLEFNPTQTTPFNLKTKIKAQVWKLINNTVFMIFPNQIKKPRILLLRLFGAKLANSVNISRTAKIDHPWNLQMGHLSSLGDYSWTYCLDRIIIGEKCCIGRDVYLLTGTHDVDDLNFKLITKPIKINDGCWIATGTYILPGVTIGEFSIVAAKSLLIKDTLPFSIVGGNPAKLIRMRNLSK